MLQQLKKRLEAGATAVFWVSMVALAYQTALLANQPKEKPTSPLSGTAKQIAELQYPEYPKELVSRFNGETAKTASPRLDSAMSREWGLASIGLFDVYSQFSREASKAALNSPCPKEVVVAVVDTGIDYTHPELRDNLWINKGETGPWTPPKELADKGYAWNCRDKRCNGIDDDANGYVDDIVGWDFVHDVPLPFDTHGHGTHIAGIIGGSAGNGLGKNAQCRSVALMSLKYYDNGGAGYNNLSNTVRAIEYAIANGAQIINYSGGGADPAASERAAVAEAQAKGILFIAAAGNDGRNNDRRPYYPASYPLDNIVGVASVNKFERLLPSSNFGKSVHVAAPGLLILSTLPGAKFGTMSGTSQATAFVTGAAAFLASQSPNGNFDYKKVKEFIVQGARPMKLNGSKQLLAAGLLSLPGSLQAQRTFLVKASGTTVSAPALAVIPPSGRFRSQIR
jgi:subtilisin family serine protease